MKSNKLLTAVFVILFLALLAEVGYIVFSNLKRPPTAKNVEVLPTAPEDVEQRAGNQAISDDVLNDLSNYNAGVLTSSTIENTLEGEIIELITTNQYALTIRLQGFQGQTNTLNFFEKELPKISVFRQNSEGVAETAAISDLKVGDRLLIVMSSDLLQDLNNGLLTTRITILNQ